MSDTEDDRPARGDGAAPSWQRVLDDPPVPVGEWTERDSVKLGIGVGLLLAGAGVGLGTLLVAQGLRADCPGSDVEALCSASRAGLEGAAVVVLSLVLAILVWLTGRVAKAALPVGSPADRTGRDRTRAPGVSRARRPRGPVARRGPSRPRPARRPGSATSRRRSRRSAARGRTPRSPVIPPVGQNRAAGTGAPTALRNAAPPDASAGKNFISVKPASSTASTSETVAVPGRNGSPVSGHRVEQRGRRCPGRPGTGRRRPAPPSPGRA